MIGDTWKRTEFVIASFDVQSCTLCASMRSLVRLKVSFLHVSPWSMGQTPNFCECVLKDPQYLDNFENFVLFTVILAFI